MLQRLKVFCSLGVPILLLYFLFELKAEGKPEQPLVEKAPSVLYLTWIHDPTTTMTVQWHTSRPSPTKVFYKKADGGAWELKEGSYGRISRTDLFVHTVELDALEPNTEYVFCLKGGQREFRFRTLPSFLSRPVRFVVGGDAYRYLGLFRKMNAQIASCDPDFVVVGGDIAYTNGASSFLHTKGWQLRRWRTFLKEWTAHMVTPDGRMIPLVPVLGNHDIRPLALNPKPADSLFYELFALPEQGISYRGLHAGNYLTLLLLDTGHSHHICGKQSEWLGQTLLLWQEAEYKMAIYHIGAYPSVYPYEGRVPQEIRSVWCPLFEKYHLDVAFEHHNHAYKRTHRMKEERIDPTGVLYMGDGSWGVHPRRPRERFYLESAAKVNAVCLVTLSQDQGTIDAIDHRGRAIDSVALR